MYGRPRQITVGCLDSEALQRTATQVPKAAELLGYKNYQTLAAQLDLTEVTAILQRPVIARRG